ncbi:hypothetical protein A1I_07260 [Rickettsia bellii OSU 85-389]|nr:hypothetical protein A1I_07260 [Rickettsia bellii OSU 85-389]
MTKKRLRVTSIVLTSSKELEEFFTLFASIAIFNPV